ncbi:hypothetical protein HMPREF9371_1116 [Neisseria shayeganii 871]|uniref:Uncharacterized protein n=1 Tax=Neisseria shayeganii 871 TaxID=1032488 RepID=G4CHM7_9NEIS|nr:hypothetical protein HMPREF9371_1116 [Neisseria shayeganii 871]
MTDINTPAARPFIVRTFCAMCTRLEILSILTIFKHKSYH